MISKEEIIKKIGSLLEDLTVKFDRVSNPDNDVHTLEFQLFEVEASYFAEHTNILRKLEEEAVNHDREVVETSAVETEETVEDQVPEKEQVSKEVVKETVSEPVFFTPPINNEIANEEKLDSQETEEEIPGQEESPAPEPRNEKTNDDDKPRDDDKANDDRSASREVNPPVAEASEAKQTEVKEEQDVKEESVNGKSNSEGVVNKIVIEEKQVSVVSDKPMSLNDRLSESRKSMATESNPSHREAPPRIRDIKSVISLNDKLMFIKDLFNGYSLAYSEAIELLNRFESFEDAQRFLQTNYAEKNSWETKQASVDKLNAILRKRYNS